MKDVVSLMNGKQALREGLEQMTKDHAPAPQQRYYAEPHVDPCYWTPVREVNWSDKIAWLEAEQDVE